MQTTDARKLLDATFEEIALVLGGIFAVHDVQDEAVWQIMKHLDVAHGNALGKLEGLDPAARRPTYPKHEYTHHPAVEALLLKLRRRPLNREGL